MRGRLLVVIAAAAVLAAACGTRHVSAGTLTAAVANTSATSSRVAVSTTMSSPGMTTTITATGEFDYAHPRGVLVMGGGVGLGGVEVRYLPPQLYFKIAGTGLPVPSGKQWIEISLPGQAAEASLAFLPTGSDVNASPADLLSALTAIASDVTDKGLATIRGVAVTHYRVTVDLTTAEAHLPPQARAEFHSFVSSLASTTLPVDIWVDGQDRVSRIALSLPMPPGSGVPTGFRITETVDYYDFGIPVVVSAPPASEIMSASAFSQSMASSGSNSGPPSQPSPPAVSGTLSAAQATAAENAVRAFWTALSSNSAQAVGQTVVPSQRSCVTAFLQGSGVKFKISSLQIISAEPTGTGTAAVSFSLNGTMQIDGQSIPLASPGTNWLQASQSGSVWYADLSNTDSSFPIPPC